VVQELRGLPVSGFKPVGPPPRVQRSIRERNGRFLQLETRDPQPGTIASQEQNHGTSEHVFTKRFSKGTTGATILAAGSPAQAAAPSPKATVLETREPTLEITGSRVKVRTGAMETILDSGRLSSLKNRHTGEEYLEESGEVGRTLELVYPHEEKVEIGASNLGETVVRQVSPLRAELLYQSYQGDGVITISVCPQTQDLLIEPSAYSSRPGVRACRWNIRGIRPDLKLVAPFFQGIKLPLSDKLIDDSHWTWPMSWEAGLAIFQSRSSGFWIHTRDNRYRYKALQIGGNDGPGTLGFDTEAYGPIDDNLAAGGLAWRINVFEGDWKIPAGIYRKWLWEAYRLDREERARRDWIRRIRMAISWCPGETEILNRSAEEIADPNPTVEGILKEAAK